MVHGQREPQVYNTWLWDSIDMELRKNCMNMDPIKHPQMSMETYLTELANEEVKNRMIYMRPQDPIDCHKKASEEVQQTLEARRLSMTDAKAMAGLYTEALKVSSRLAAFVKNRSPRAGTFETSEPMEVDCISFL